MTLPPPCQCPIKDLHQRLSACLPVVQMFDCPPFCLKTNICWSSTRSQPPPPPPSLADLHLAKGGRRLRWRRRLLLAQNQLVLLLLTHIPDCTSRGESGPERPAGAAELPDWLLDVSVVPNYPLVLLAFKLSDWLSDWLLIQWSAPIGCRFSGALRLAAGFSGAL